MTVMSTQMPASMRPVVRFFRTPKGILLPIFAALLVIASLKLGVGPTYPRVAFAAVVAAGVDMAMTYVVRRKWIVPDGAALTGMIIAFILRSQEGWDVLAVTVVLAIVSKHVLRTRWSNVLNPAALALFVAAIVMNTGQNWWGALPDLGVPGALIVLVAGAFIADRLNKLTMVFAFLAAYFALFSIASTFDGTTVAEIFRTPDLQAVLFFAFFMLDDPPTSPVRHEDQIAFGIIVAAVAYFVFREFGGVYFLLIGLLVGNVWESGRRIAVHAVRTRGVRLPAELRSVRTIAGVASALVAMLLLAAAAGGGPPGTTPSPATVSASAAPDPTAAPAFPFLADFNADVKGTYSQSRSGNSSSITIDASLSGDLTLKMHLELSTTAAGGQAQPTVTLNKAQLLDSRTNAVVCDGQLTAFSSGRIAATCVGAGPYAGVNMSLQPILNADSGTTLSGSMSGTMTRTS